MVDLGIKSAVKDWMSEKWKNWVRDPIANKTIQLEGQVQQTVNPHLNQAKAQINKPIDYYWKQEAFYRGLFWICVLLLIVLWILSGS